MHELRLRAQAREMWDGGSTTREVAAALDLPYGTVVKWRKRRPTDEWLPCPRGEVQSASWRKAYAYLLGLYLGDGHLVTRARAPVLRIYCSTDYPGIVDQAELGAGAFVEQRAHDHRPVVLDALALSVSAGGSRPQT